MKSEKNKPRTCVYWSTEEDKLAFERDAKRAGVTVSHFGHILFEARRSGIAFLQTLRYIDPDFYAKLMSGHTVGAHTDALIREAEARAEAAERRAASFLAERDRLALDLKAQAMVVASLQNALRTAESRAAAARRGEAHLAALHRQQASGEAPAGLIASDSGAVVRALSAGRLYPDELLDVLSAQNGWSRERAEAEVAYALAAGIISPPGFDGRYGKPMPRPWRGPPDDQDTTGSRGPPE